MDKFKKTSTHSQRSEINGYRLSRQWFDFVQWNPDLIKPVHGALYFWIIEHANILQWDEVIGLPTMHAMKMIGIKDRRFFRKALYDLVTWGFIRIVYKAKNQSKSNEITLLLREKGELKYIPKDVKEENIIKNNLNEIKQKARREIARINSNRSLNSSEGIHEPIARETFVTDEMEYDDLNWEPSTGDD